MFVMLRPVLSLLGPARALQSLCQASPDFIKSFKKNGSDSTDLQSYITNSRPEWATSKFTARLDNLEKPCLKINSGKKSLGLLAQQRTTENHPYTVYETLNITPSSEGRKGRIKHGTLNSCVFSVQTQKMTVPCIFGF